MKRVPPELNIVFSPFRARINRVSRTQGVALGWHVTAPFGANSISNSMTQGVALGWHVTAPFGANSNSKKRDVWAREPGPSAFRLRFSARTA